MKLKRITSLTLSWSFVLLVLSSLIMYVMPQGKVAYWANWSWGGLEKETWGAVHTNIGYLFLLACALHVYFNWSHILNYIKNRGAQLKLLNGNNIVSLGLVIGVSILTVFNLPPVSWIQDLGNHFKDQAIVKYGNPPYGHAELSSLFEFCRRTGTDLDTAIQKLKDHGIMAEANQSILSIADSAKMTPQALANLFSAERSGSGNHGTYEHEEGLHAEEHLGSGSSVKSGYGQKTLKSVCHELGLDYDETAKLLKAAGYHPKPNATLKDIAGEKGERPNAIMGILKPEGH